MRRWTDKLDNAKREEDKATTKFWFIYLAVIVFLIYIVFF